MSAVDARGGADVHDIIGFPHRFLVVLHHYKSVAEVAQTFKRRYQLAVVPLVQPYARLVKDIQHADQRRAYLRGKPDALCLAARKRARFAREREIFQPHALEEAQTRIYLFFYFPCYYLLGPRKAQAFKKIGKRADRQRAQLAYIQPADRHGKRLLLQPSAPAGRTRHRAHEGFVILALLERGLRIVPALYGRRHALEPRLRIIRASAGRLPVFVAVKQHLQRLFRKILYRRMQRKSVFFPKLGQHRAVIAALLYRFEAVNGYRTAVKRKAFVGYYQLGRNDKGFAQPVTVRTRAERAVEREHARRKLAERDTVGLAGVILGKYHLLLAAVGAEDDYPYHPARKRRGRFYTVRQPRKHAGLLHDETVDDDVYRVLYILVKLYLFRKVVHAAVHADADIAAFGGVLEHLFVHPLFRADYRRQHHEAHAVLQRRKLVHYLVHRLLLYHLAAYRAVRHADARVQKPQIVVYLGHGPHGRARVLGGGLLVYRDSRGKPLYRIDVRLVELAEEHARV